MTFDTSILDTFPTLPGVYIMKDRKEAVLYVGKAKSLRSRVKQYFGKSGDGRAMIPYLVAKVATIETIVVTSEKEALLLENTLIKANQPQYNTIYRDDKSYISLYVNTESQWPSVSLVRYHGTVKVAGRAFGPYTSTAAARQTLDLLQRLFPLRQCSDAEFARRDRPCILHQMKRCLAPCVAKCSHEEYAAAVDRMIRFLQGSDRTIIDNLWKELEGASEKMEFEKAGRVHSLIKSLECIIEPQRVDRAIAGNSDVVGLYRQGDEVLIVVLPFREGKLTGSRQHAFQGVVDEDEDMLRSFLLQTYDGTKAIPAEVLLPIELPEFSEVSEILSSIAGRKISVHTPQRGDKKSLVAMAHANAEAAFAVNRDAAAMAEKSLLALLEQLRLRNHPSIIECYDTSHLAGSEPVVGLVVYTDGEKDKKRYRTYKVKSAKPGDDYGAMREVLQRRLQRGREEDDLPNLIIVDGGKGHLNLAVEVLQELDIVSVDLIGLSKEAGRHDKGMTTETVHLTDGTTVHVDARSPLLHFLQQIRDEAHRFAITFQKNRRTKATIRTELSVIPGIGPSKEKALLKAIGSVKRIREASDADLLAVKGISQKNLLSIRAALGVG